MKYIVKRIEEDLNFGCEERGVGAPVMAVVTLVDEAGQELTIRQPDQMLYDRDINEGDVVKLDEERKLQKSELNSQGDKMDCREYINQEVHRLYWEHDTNCARTTMHCLSGLFDIKIEEQTWNAAVGMHGAGGFRAQCGLVEGGLMFLGIYCAEKKISRAEAVKICYQYASDFQDKFGALRCQELRPTGR